MWKSSRKKKTGHRLNALSLLSRSRSLWERIVPFDGIITNASVGAKHLSSDRRDAGSGRRQNRQEKKRVLYCDGLKTRSFDNCLIGKVGCNQRWLVLLHQRARVARAAAAAEWPVAFFFSFLVPFLCLRFALLYPHYVCLFTVGRFPARFSLPDDGKSQHDHFWVRRVPRQAISRIRFWESTWRAERRLFFSFISSSSSLRYQSMIP